MSGDNSHPSQQQPPPHTPRSESPAPSSGVATPSGNSARSSTFLSNSVSHLWGGLVRHFSTDMTGTSPDSTSPSLSPSSHHSHTFPTTSANVHHSHTFPTTGASANGVDGVFNPLTLTHRTASPMRPPPLEPLSLRGFKVDTKPNARLLTAAIAEELRIMVPARLSIVDEWNLVYSLDQDGASMSTLYEKCGRYEGKRVAFVLAIKDCEGGLFGAYLSDIPHPAPNYFGTGECFLWRVSLATALPPPPSADTDNLTRATTIASTPVSTQNHSSGTSTTTDSPSSTSSSASSVSHNHEPPDIRPLSNGPFLQPPASPSIRFKAFPYSGINEYYMFCETHYLSVGGGDGRYGLWLDDSLSRGVSSTCMTFGNEPLSDEGEKFGILGVEVWVIGAGPP